MAKDLMIGIGAQFRGEKAFKQANKNMATLQKTVRNVAGAFGVAFGARALANYSRNAVKAFAEDDKAARSLSLTLKNLGLAFEDTRVKNFISLMEQQYHIVDDLLRPAYQKLLTVTGSVAQSQSLLQTSLNVSAATGSDLQSVVDILTKAYLGQTRGLAKLGVSLTKTQLQAMSFEEILAVINKTFAGQAAQAANTYKGKVDALNVSLANAQEIIGKGIIDALQTLADDNNFDTVTGKIESMATALADATRGFGAMIDKVTGSGFGKVLGYIGKTGLVGMGFSALQSVGSKQRIAQAQANTGGGIGGSLSMNERLAATEAKKRAAAEAKARKDRAAQLAIQKKLNQAQLDALKQKKLGAIFDQEQISIMAALQGKITDEERKRLELMLAIQTGNVNEAQKLATELAKAQGINSLIATQLRQLPDAKNPFENWSTYLKAIEEQIARIAAAGQGGGGGGGMPSTNVDASGFATNNPSFQFGSSTPWAQAAQNFTITVEGGDELTTLMRYKIAEASSSGSGVNWSQTVGAYDR